MKFFERIRANTSPPLDENIDYNMFARIFSPFFFKKDTEFNLLHFISSGMRLKTKRNWGNHTEKWRLMDDALEKNSSALGLMASWSIFEGEAKRKFKLKLMKIGSGRNKSMISNASELLNLKKNEIEKLNRIVKKRNGIAHKGLTNISWSEVDLILDFALKLHMK